MARRKELPPAERKVDLHRKSVAQGLAALEAELAYCRAGRVSPILVITGRGAHNPGGKPILKPAVVDWLRGPKGQGYGVVEVRETPWTEGALWVRLAWE